MAYTSSADEPAGPDNASVEHLRGEKDLAVDMLMDVDWVRFSRPPGHRAAGPPNDRAAALASWYAQVNGKNTLTDPNLPETELLTQLGE